MSEISTTSAKGEAGIGAKPKLEPPKDRLKEMAQYFNEEDVRFKVGIALVSAVSAAAVIIISGIHSERLLEVIAMRSMVGFFLAGGIVFLALLWLDDVGIPLYVSHNHELQKAWLSEPEEGLSDDSVKASDAQKAADQETEAPDNSREEAHEMQEREEQSSFAPLDDSIEHVHTAE